VVIIEPSQKTYKYFENYFIETLIQCTYNWKIHKFKFYLLFNTLWRLEKYYLCEKKQSCLNIKLLEVWCDFDCASSLICVNKMPTRCNRGFYCRSYCLLNMFWAPLCPLSGAQGYYMVVAACGIWCCGFQVVGLMWSWGLWQHPANQTQNPQLHFRPTTWKPQHQIPQAATTV